jgi:GNAT superfamily N-acetyltransferase
MSRITRADPQDAEALAGILGDWLGATAWMPKLHSAAENRAFLGRMIGEQEVFVLRDAKSLSGFMALERGEARSATITALYLTPQARNHGFGKALVDLAKTQAETLTLWTFQANHQAQRFYLREGFAESRRTAGDNEENLPDIQFVWHAKAPS